MEKRVFRTAGFGGRLLNGALLFLSAVVLLSGLATGGAGDSMSVAVKPTETPIPLEEAFDETPDSREWTTPRQLWYALQLGTFDNAESAKELAGQYRQRGAAGFVWEDNRFRTLAALYVSREDAQGVRTKLWENHGIDAYPYEIELPALTLRMSGMKGQLDAMQAAFERGQELIAALQDLSTRMDRQETTVGEAQTELQALRESARTVSLRLQQRFAKPRHASVDALIALFDELTAFCDALPKEPSAVELATDVKYQALSTLYRLKTVCDQMSAT